MLFLLFQHRHRRSDDRVGAQGHALDPLLDEHGTSSMPSFSNHITSSILCVTLPMGASSLDSLIDHVDCPLPYAMAVKTSSNISRPVA